MATLPKAWLVSDLQGAPMQERHTQNENHSYVSRNFKELKTAVGEALRDVKFCNIGVNVAVVYRPGDIFSLGEIGYKNTKAKGNGEVNYYVQARGIVNAKYKDSSWQHHIVSTKVLKSAVKAAATHLRHPSAEDGARETVNAAATIIRDTVDTARNAAMKAYRDLTGNTPYSGSMRNEFTTELRLMTFINPALNQALAEFGTALDLWVDAESASSKPVRFVGLSDNYGQVVADVVKVDLNKYYTNPVEAPAERKPLEALPEALRGRMAVLNMVAPQTYVQGVGLRLDDRIFYVLGEETE